MVKKRSEIKKIVSHYARELEKQGIMVSQIILYGSYAKRKPKEYSDIDIAVVSPSFEGLDIFERQEILSKAHHKFGEPLEPIGFVPEQMKEKTGFAREVIESGVVIYRQG
jgi:predicted nucleotidyltransferase